jgi:hypothetical protein
MANNVAITAGSGTTMRSDDVSGVQYPYVKLADGTEDATTVIAAGNGVAAGALRVSVASDSTGVLLPGTGATNFGKAEDAAHTSGDVGVMMLGVRNDAGTVLAGTTGDYIPFSFDANGYVRVNVVTGAISLTGESHLGEVGGSTAVIRPTVAVDTAIYAALDVLGAAATSGVVVLTNAMRLSGGTGLLQSVVIYDDDNEKSPITLMFFNAAPASGTYTGNGALALSTGDKATYLGRVDIAATDYLTVGGDAVASIKNIALPVQAVGTANIYMIPIVTSGTPTYTASTDLQMALGFLRD